MSDTKAEKHIDISKAIKAEVAQLKKPTSSLFHIKYMGGVHGSGFLVFEPSERVRQRGMGCLKPCDTRRTRSVRIGGAGDEGCLRER